MDESQRENCKLLRDMGSPEAADWLLTNYPKDGCFYIAKRSWKKSEQLRLAEHFLKTAPHASATCYDALLTIMSITNFLSVLEKYIPENSARKELLRYYLAPSLNKAASSERDKETIAYFMSKF